MPPFKTLIFLIQIYIVTTVEILADESKFISEQFPVTDTIDPEYDFIIIGAGTAGCTLANRLSEISGWKILLIEAGTPETLKLDIPSYISKIPHSSNDWEFESIPSPKYGSALNNGTLFIPRGKVVGGSSSINFMVYTRGSPTDYDAWFRGGNLNWSKYTAQTYFKKLENYTVEPENSEFGHQGPIHIENVKTQSDFGKSYIQAVEQSGYVFKNINGDDQLGTSFTQFTAKNGLRMSANQGYLTPIRDRKNLHLKTECLVSKINFKQLHRPTADTVTFMCGNETFEIKATREVILSAGAIGSPQILMLSGIGPSQHLSELNIPILSDLPVGKNLMDHIYPGGVQFTINETLNTDEMSKAYLSLPKVISFTLSKNEIPTIEHLMLENSVLDFPGFAIRIWNLNETIFNEIYKPFLNQSAYTVLTLLQKPKSQGWVKLRDTNPLSKPIIFHNLFDDPDDVETLLSGIKESIQISQQEPLRKWNSQIYAQPLPMCKDYEFGSDDYWRCYIKAFPCTLYHVCGTNKMGHFMDKTTVVNRYLMVHGVEKLRVVDASIMPEIPSGHLTGPTIMIAEHAADLIKAYWGK